MKLLAKVFCSAVMVSIIAGCASKDSVYIPTVPVGVQQALLDYEMQPDNKVFILAVDPGGDYAYGYDYGKATLKEAAKVAVEKVDAQRVANGVVGTPYIYALNGKVVWADSIRSAHGEKTAKEEPAAEEEPMAEEAPAEEDAEAM